MGLEEDPEPQVRAQNLGCDPARPGAENSSACGLLTCGSRMQYVCVALSHQVCDSLLLSKSTVTQFKNLYVLCCFIFYKIAQSEFLVITISKETVPYLLL